MITFLLTIIAVIQLAQNGGKWLAVMLVFIVSIYGLNEFRKNNMDLIAGQIYIHPFQQ